MSQFLLDTSALSDALRGQPEPLAFSKWLDANLADCFLSAITIHEFEYGIAKLALRKAAEDRLRAADFMRLDAEILRLFSGRILPASEYVLFRAGTLRAKAAGVCGDIGLADSIIAATAEIRGLHVITSNVIQFKATGVSIIDVLSFHQSLEQALAITVQSTGIRDLRTIAQKVPLPPDSNRAGLGVNLGQEDSNGEPTFSITKSA